jgi:signal transduction histidine kinase/DNA-binding response OmpR family regulator
MRNALYTLLRSPDHRLERRIVLALLLGLTLTFVIHFFSSTSIRHLLASDEKVMFNFALDNALEDLDHQLISLESNLRSYIISDADGLLAEIGSNMASAQSKMNLITDMVVVIPGQSDDINRLDGLLTKKIDFTAAVLDSFSRSGEEAAIALVNTQEGLRLRDSIIRITSRLRQLERQNITQTIELNRNEAQEVSRIDYMSTLLAAGMVLLAIFFFLRAIEYRKTIQSKLEEARLEAERSAEIKEQFIANMSHEIRTPLHAMLSFSEILSESRLDSKQKECLEGILRSGENLDTIVNDILDFSKMEAGMVQLEKIPFQLEKIWANLELLFTAKAQAKNLKLSFECLPGSESIILGDPTRLNQILINLISNAIKFTETGGVQIVGYLRREAGKDQVLEVRVSDSGIGIPEDKIDAIFERFRQGDTTTSRRFGGTGLGLAIVKHLIELQGGQIHCHSILGQGSTFTFRIPYETATEAHQRDTEAVINVPALGSLTGGRILLAEDNRLNRQILSMHLKDWGYDFDLVENGLEALALAGRFAYDLIMLDIQMPGLDGYQVARQIREKGHTSVPIIAITANSGVEEKKKCLAAGMNDCLQKPFRKKDLLQVFHQHGRPAAEARSEAMAITQNEAPASVLIDFEYLSSITKGKTDRRREMATLFLEQAPREFADLEKAALENDYDQLARLAHNMQSTVAYMGMARSLGDTLRQLETQARQRTGRHRILELLENLSSQLQQALATIRRELLPH